MIALNCSSSDWMNIIQVESILNAASQILYEFYSNYKPCPVIFSWDLSFISCADKIGFQRKVFMKGVIKSVSGLITVRYFQLTASDFYNGFSF